MQTYILYIYTFISRFIYYFIYPNWKRLLQCEKDDVADNIAEFGFNDKYVKMKFMYFLILPVKTPYFGKYVKVCIFYSNTISLTHDDEM